MSNFKIDLVAVFIFVCTAWLCFSTTDVLYIPMIDKICLLEKLNLSLLFFKNETTFSAVTTFAHCVGICYQNFLYSNYQILSFDTVKKRCTHYAIGSRMRVDNTENANQTDIAFYFIEECVNVNSSHTVDEGEVEENISENDTILLAPLHEICTVERLSFGASRKAKRIDIIFYCAHLEICLSNCRVTTSPAACNAVLFSSSEGICTLLDYKADQRQNNENSPRKFISDFFVLHDCRYAKEAVESQMQTLHDYAISEHQNIQIQMESLRKVIICDIYRLPFAEKFLSMRINLWLTNALEDCLKLCIFNNSTSGNCNSVYYSKKLNTCLIFNIVNESNVHMENTTHSSPPFIYYLNNCTEKDKASSPIYDSENESGGEYFEDAQEYRLDEMVYENYNIDLELEVDEEEEDDDDGSMSSSFTFGNIIFEQGIINSSATETVKFYDFMEICITEKLDFKLVEYAVASDIPKICWSLNSCLQACRSSLTRTGCRAVLFSRQNSKCFLLSIGSIFDNVAVHPEEELVRLVSCKKDRENERANNPEPLRYYIEEMRQVCLIELYTLTVLTSWIPIKTITDVDSLQKCLQFCVTEKQCSAFNFSNMKECALHKSGSLDDIYSRPNNSVFAEILYCEPGNLINLLY
ncbi:hypothetical protein T4A_5532 [Trichinella pseudospiralis]|uniref:Apple domain-containing protein n=2 Tax=Trichinella pseudospiralis TaxID=6337 RepID=A0A0V1KA64_TRIPS|nr:hypothetical protein T4A_5532 [Trichinella pseudospiralis]KRZ44082.1 hypothetical protein T4C_9230 [Trichinella pseudospiralis]